MSLKQLFKPDKTVSKTVAAETNNPSVSTHSNDEHRERSHSEIMVIMGALMLAMLLAALDQTIVATALPQIATDLHGLDKLSWVATSYLITGAITTPIYGKLGDLYGRKKIFQISIIIFLIGSALCGLSRNMDQLVAFRALQGIGGGGLMSLVLAIIGDVIPPRQRGRYQGYFGAVFGLSSVVGPLLGGFLAGAHSLLGISGWRYIFYINLPLGALALVVVAARLHLPKLVNKHKIDYIGAALLAASVVSLVLVSIWAGVTYAWGSSTIIGLLVAGIVLAIAFAVWERKASEPLIPPTLFKNGIFTTSVLLSALTGVAMFASILYIPEYQQVVLGYSPTKSGLALLPLVLGIFAASITSGRLITHWGRYKIFPIIGTTLLGIGVWLFSHVGIHTDYWILASWMVVIGLGLGQLMQVPTLAVQNSVERKRMGVATSATVFFRQMGASLGGAIFGTILVARLTKHLEELLPGGGNIAAKSIHAGTQHLAHAPAAVRHDVLLAFVQSFHDMFLIAIPFVAAAFLVALFLRETPLRTSTKDTPESASPLMTD